MTIGTRLFNNKKQTTLMCIAAALITLTFTPLQQTASTLSCIGPEESPLERMQAAAAVFVGEVQNTHQSDENSSIVGAIPGEIYHNVIVMESYKGPLEDEELKVYVDATWGSTELERNKPYLMILSHIDGELEEQICRRGGIIAMDNPRVSEYLDQVANIDREDSGYNALLDTPAFIAAAAFLFVGGSVFFLKKIQNRKK